MFKTETKNVVAATIGALIFTTVTVGAAVGPARTAETSPVAAPAAENPSHARA